MKLSERKLRKIIKREFKEIFPGFERTGNDEITRKLADFKEQLPKFNSRDLVNLEIRNPKLRKDMKRLRKKLKGVEDFVEEMIEKSNRNKYNNN
jgi:hypothetical protein